MLGITFSEAAPLRDKKPKKEKKDKKHKKDKKTKSKAKEKRHANSGSSSDDSRGGGSDSGDDAGHAPGSGNAPREEQQAAPLQREDWMDMTASFLDGDTKRQQEEKEEEERAKATPEPEIVPGLRIMKAGGGNPNPKAGGNSFGPRVASATSLSNPDVSNDSPSGAGGAVSGGRGGAGGGRDGLPPRSNTPTVGDGGLSWRLKALKRAQEAAAAAGQDVSGVVSERWGSLQNLTNALTEGRAADSNAHLRAARERDRGSTPSTGSGRQSHYLSDLRSDSRPAMKKPTESDNLRWRRPRDSGGSVSASEQRSTTPGVSMPGGSEHNNAAARASDADQARDGRSTAGHGDVRDKKYGGDRDRARDGDRHERDARNGDRGDKYKDDRRQGHDDRARRDDVGEDRRSGRGERDAHDRDRRYDRYDDRRRDDRVVRGGGDDLRRGSSSVARHMSREQEAALQSVAASMNRHADDGSFMDRFQKQQKDEQGRGHADDRRDAEGRPGERAKPSNNGQSQKQAMADAMREEMRQLKQGMGGGDEDGGGSDVDNAPGNALEEMDPMSGDNDDDVDESSMRTRGRTDDSSDAGAAGGGGRGTRSESSGPPPAVNRSAADLLRARLKGLPAPTIQPTHPRPVNAHGDDEHDRHKHGKHHHHKHDRDGSRKEVVALPLVDASGRAVKGAFGRESAGAAQQHQQPPSKKRPVQRYDESGEKVRYFADDDVDLDTLVKRTRYGDDATEQLDRSAVNNIIKKARFKEKDMDVDDEYDYDGGMDLYESKSKKGDANKQAAREHSRQVAAFNRAQKAAQGCTYCISNPRRPAHLTIAAGTAAYLMLPQRGRLVPGHCCIVPKDHVASLRMVDDNVWTEVKNFIKCLIQMFAAQGKHVIFWETATQLGGVKRHAVLEAVPVSPKEIDKAPGYFKKAMQEAESEWSTHAAKSAIQINAKKGLRESIPPNFPYLYVQFDYGSGFVHVIDDESKFDVLLGRQVLVGLLRLPPEEMHARGKMESQATQQQWAREFIAQWAPYDWTLQL